jgi:hypothetical protein
MNTNSNRSTAETQSGRGEEVTTQPGLPGLSAREEEEAAGAEEAAVAEEAAAPETAVAGEAAAPETAVAEEAVARRTPTGWRVGGEEVPDLTSAMVLADLLAADLPSDEQWQAPGGAANRSPVAADQATISRPEAAAEGSASPGTSARGEGTRDAGTQDSGTQDSGTQDSGTQDSGTQGSTTHGAGKEGSGAHVADPPAEQLKETVAQLERALTVRVRVEQAIGVLAERHRLRPRQAFELLRSASRARGARVSQTAGEVVASVTNPLLRIPEELARQPEGHRGRSSRHPRRKT